MTRRTFSRCLALGPALAALALGSTSLLAMYRPGYRRSPTKGKPTGKAPSRNPPPQPSPVSSDSEASPAAPPPAVAAAKADLDRLPTAAVTLASGAGHQILRPTAKPGEELPGLRKPLSGAAASGAPAAGGPVQGAGAGNTLQTLLRSLADDGLEADEREAPGRPGPAVASARTENKAKGSASGRPQAKAAAGSDRSAPSARASVPVLDLREARQGAGDDCPWIRLTVPLEPGSLRAAGMPGARPSLWVPCENGLGREVVFALAEGTAADAGTTCVHRTDGSKVELKPGQKDRCPLQPREAIALSVAGDGEDRDYQVLEADGETLVTMVRFSFR